MRATRIELSEARHTELEIDRKGEQHCFKMRCLTVLLKTEKMSSARVGERVGMDNSWLRKCREEGLEARPGIGRKTIMGCTDEEAVHQASEQNWQSVNKANKVWWRTSGKEACGSTFKCFFIHIGARYRHIKKPQKGKPSSQLYGYKVEKLQELERQAAEAA